MQDPTFRDWCGDSLCDWTLDSGRIQRVPTWNADDFGVSFLDPGTQISQVTSESQATCLLFKTVADIDPAAQMTLLVDFDNDGHIDFQAPLGATDWHEVQAEISAPPQYTGITFHVRKEGTGTAVLAEMQVLSTTGCAPAPPIPVPPVPFGAKCTQGRRVPGRPRLLRRRMLAVQRRHPVPGRRGLRGEGAGGAPLRTRAEPWHDGRPVRPPRRLRERRVHGRRRGIPRHALRNRRTPGARPPVPSAASTWPSMAAEPPRARAS